MYRDPDGKTGRFTARLGQLGARRVLDVEPEDLGVDVSDVYKSLLLPMHGFVFFETRGEALHWAVLEGDTLRRYLERNPMEIPHITLKDGPLKDGIVFTGSSSELQRFLTREKILGRNKMAADDPLFRLIERLVRADSKIEQVDVTRDA